MQRNLRSSAKKEAEEKEKLEKRAESSARKEAELKEKLEERAEVTKKSLELQKVIEENKESLDKEIEELCSIIPEQTSSDDSEDEFESPKSQFVSENSLAWDQLADIDSPLKDTSDILDLDTTFQYPEDQDLLPPALNSGRSVSVSVNRADYVSLESGELADLHPVCKDLNLRFENPAPNNSLGLISQDSFLERNLQAKQVEVFSLIDEELDVNEVREEEVSIPGNKMDSETYKGHLVKVTNDARKVKWKIKDYTAEDVSIADSQDYKENLKIARNAFEKVREDLYKVIDLLDPNTEQVRIDELETILSELNNAIKKNEREVKDKMTEILDQAAANKPPSEEDLKKEELKAQKLIKRIGFLKEKAVENKNKVLKLKKASEMTDNEIREKFIESKNWEKITAEMCKSKEDIEAESVGLNIDAKEILEMKESVQASLDAMVNKIENLKLEDNTRGLFTAINKNISRENVVFPENFSGEFGENVFKFKEKFLQALLDSQIREKDKVEVLRKHLSGHAKTLIGSHYTSIDKALESLLSYFGNEKRIWKKCKERFEGFFAGSQFKVWGNKGDEQRIMAVSRCIEFLREAMELGENYKELKGQIYSDSTLDSVLKVLPENYDDEWVKLTKGQSSKADIDVQFEALKDLLESMKDQEIRRSNMPLRKEYEGSKKINTYEDGRDLDDERWRQDRGRGHRGSFGGRRGRQVNYRGGRGRQDNYGGGRDHQDGYRRSGDGSESCKLCNNGRNCKTAWGGLGCIEIYRLKTLEERVEYLKSFRLCFDCGAKHPWTQRCAWFKNSVAKCATQYCKYGAIVCRFKHPKNMSSELQDWIKKAGLDPLKMMNSLVIGSNNISRQNNELLHNRQSRSSIPISKISNQERDMLQRGASERMMTDSEIAEYFETGSEQVNVNKPDIRPIPEGEPVFIMNIFQGKTRPVLAFIDGGCNCWVAKQGIPETELVSVKMKSGPIPVGVASGMTVYASAEWASLIPLADGGMQAVRGLTMANVTQEMPKINMDEVFKAVKKTYRYEKSIQKLKVPKVLGGQVDMIIGIKYQNIYPELVHQFPNGLAVYKSKLLSVSGQSACIGGPIGALDGLGKIFAGNTMGYMIQLTQVMKSYKPRMEFFPDAKPKVEIVDTDIPGIVDLLDDDEEIRDENLMINCINCGDEVIENLAVHSVSVQSELKKFMQQQEAGLDSSYKCPKCRNCGDCVKGSGYERISLKQEAEQELIKESVKVDLDKGRAEAELPFKVAEPSEYLGDNKIIAQKRLQNVVRKYHNDEKVKSEIIAAFDKLRMKGHIKFYEDLSQGQRDRLEAKTGYTIPWDVVWKETSLSTPARTVYDASSKTSTGFSLNDILATGIPDLVKLIDVLVDWHVGPVAFVGDVSQFYCSIGLVEKSWPYQKLLLREDLNPNGRLIKAVIVSAIFGVCSSGGQSEEVIRQFCELIRIDYPDVVRILLERRYVDDILKSVESREEALDIIKKTEEALQKIDMKIKGWSISGEDPPEQLTDDGVSVGFSGLTWFPAIDSFKLNISNLHFGKKKRGKLSSELDIYDPNVHRSVEEFVKDKVITRRNCTSVVARNYDNFGKLEPLKLRMKHDLRQLIYENKAWDDPISSEKRLRWCENFKMLQDCQDIMYTRCSIPKDAVSLKARCWILCDAADGGIMIGAYIGFEMPGNRWTCSNILGKSLLAPEEWTIPKKELQGLTVASNMKVIIERALEGWIDAIYIGCDSEIALAWTIYDNVKLNIFHRNRVSNIRSRVKLEQLHHVQGVENCADVGTRPDSVKTESLLPGAPWLSGREWMRKSYEEALADGVIKTVNDIKLSNEAKKEMKEGIIFDQFEFIEANSAVLKAYSIDIKKVADNEEYSKYIFPPLKRSFRPTVRIVSLVLLAVKRWKEHLIRRKARAGKADLSELDVLRSAMKVRFTIFQVVAEDNLDENKENLTEVFGNSVVCKVKKKERETKAKETMIYSVELTDEDLSEGLEYLFKKSTQEILKFENMKDVQKIGVMKDDVLFCNSRILEGQELQTVGCLKETLDLETFTGVKFCVPLVSKNSPLAISIALHLHYNGKHKHKGVETSYRLSLQHARILQGKQLFKQVADDCIYCKKLKLKYVKQLMGPFSDTQLCISPIFYFTYIDMWGPLTIYCPGYEKRTRNRQQAYEVHVLVMGCAVTATINCQIIEKKDTGAVLDGLNRFFHEVCVPKICYPDKDGALMKALQDGEIDILDMQGRLHRERGLYFETCLPQGHYQHGRIERRIRMLQDSLQRSEIRKSRCTATGWQTICKAIEHEVNSVPLGFLHHQGSSNPLLRILCPNLLKKCTFTDRAPKGLFSIPNSAEDLMTNIEKTYNTWFQVWNCEYLPLVMDRPKWNQSEENLKENDIVYFKLTDSKLSADWRFGKIEYAITGRDGNVRSVGISYKTMIEDDKKVYNEDFEWKNSMVERPVRAVVKLTNLEDTSLLEDMKKVQDLVKEIIDNKASITKNSKEPDDDKLDSNDDGILDTDGPEADDVKETIDESSMEPKQTNDDSKKIKKKRKTEVEKLLEDNTGIKPEHLRRENRRFKNVKKDEVSAVKSSTKPPKNSYQRQLVQGCLHEGQGQSVCRSHHEGGCSQGRDEGRGTV